MIGTTVSHYRIVETLGSGGMGIVHRAIDLRLDRPAAIKMLSASVANGVREPNQPHQDRFIQEARACGALDHPNIGVVDEIGDTATGETFIAMAYYDGQTLADVVGTSPTSKCKGLIADARGHRHLVPFAD
jgi:serine/threonine protein kinase